MKLLVTGATGFIGGHVVEASLERGHDVRALVRAPTPSGRLAQLGAEIAHGDLTDPGSIERAVRGVDGVLHLAALYTFWSPDADAFERANVDGTRAVVRACGAAGVRLVHCSTVAAVGGADRRDGLLDEDADWNLGSTGDPYVVTKRRAEEVVLEAAARGEVDAVVVNPSAPLGPRDARPTPTGDLLVKFLNRLVFFWVDGGLNVVDVRDVARGHLLAFEKGRAGERYILGAENLELRDLLVRFARLTGTPEPVVGLPHPAALAGARAIETVSRLARRPPLVTAATARAARYYLFFSHDKAARELGYAPAPVDGAIREAAGWFAEHAYLRPRAARRVLAHLEAPTAAGRD